MKDRVTPRTKQLLFLHRQERFSAIGRRASRPTPSERNECTRDHHRRRQMLIAEQSTRLLAADITTAMTRGGCLPVPAACRHLAGQKPQASRGITLFYT